MTKGRRTSVVILITLAELAWLAAFGLLFAYRGQVKESRGLWKEYAKATNAVAELRGASTNVAALLDELNRVNNDRSGLQARLDTFTKHLQGKSPGEVADLLRAGERAAEATKAAEERAQRLEIDLGRTNVTLEATRSALRSATSALAELRRKWDALPPGVEHLESLYRDATNRVAELAARLTNAHTNISSLSSEIVRLQKGEIAIRRELTGLPTNELRRVVFVVDTLSSMRTKPEVWNEARRLMRTWVEHLSVKECRLVNFNDTAVAFPKDRYLQVRDVNGLSLTNAMGKLLTQFDEARSGTYSDLLKGLRLAYSRDNPDLIVVLTDGHPHIGTRMDGSFATEILKEVARHPTPILAVAVGSYEMEGVGGPKERRNSAIAFMKELARTTGGNFLGR